MRLSILLAGVVAVVGISGPARAVDGPQFIVSDNDGYGIAECMKPGMECGRVIADAWCEAHGHGHAEAFGLSEDVTGAVKVSVASTTPTPPGSVIIRCGD